MRVRNNIVSTNGLGGLSVHLEMTARGFCLNLFEASGQGLSGGNGSLLGEERMAFRIGEHGKEQLPQGVVTPVCQ